MVMFHSFLYVCPAGHLQVFQHETVSWGWVKWCTRNPIKNIPISHCTSHKKHQIVYPVVYQYPIVYAYIYIHSHIYISQVLYIYIIYPIVYHVNIYIHSVMGTYDISHSQNMSHDPRDLFTAPNVRTSIAGARGRWMGKPWVVMAPEVYTRPGKCRKTYGIDGWKWPIYGWFTHENHGDFQWLCWITRYATTIQGDTRWCPISR